MKMIHTADWHVGRVLHGASLLEDQATLLLDQLVPLVREERPDIVVIAGDVYDRSVPHHEAVELLDEVLHRIVVDAGAPTLVIAGNHDSGERLGFGARLLARGNLHVRGVFPGAVEPLVLDDQHGSVHFYLLPYVIPAEARQALERDDLSNQDQAISAITEQIRKSHPKGERNVLVAHLFVSGASESESERPLVGGTHPVDPEALAGFNYVALGHLHRPQKVRDATIRYAGSLMKYSFSEAEHKKSVSVIEIDEAGKVRARVVPLEPRRDLRCVRGTLDELLSGYDPNADDYVEITLTDTKPVFDAMRRLRDIYPNILHLRRIEAAPNGASARVDRDLRRLEDAKLFRDFYQMVTGEALNDAQATLYDNLVGSVRNGGAGP